MGILWSGPASEHATRMEAAYTSDGLLDFTRMTTVFKDSSIVGSYNLTLNTIGVCELAITTSMIKWCGAHCFAKHVHFSNKGAKMKFRIFCPFTNTSDGSFSSGVYENFVLNKASDGGFTGTFRRDGESRSQHVVLTRKIPTPASIAAALLTIDRKDSNEGCPVCLEEFDQTDVIKVVTKCNHAFCIGCIMEICELEPPHTEGHCPMCRAVVKTEELRVIVDDSGNGGAPRIGSSRLR